MTQPLFLGAVAYDPKVVTIWDGFSQFFNANGLPFDYVLFTNYEQQVRAQMAGQIDVAWHSPLAWLQIAAAAQAHGRHAEAFAMRDTDQNLCSAIVVAANGPVRNLSDLQGQRVAVGAHDSPQATLIPLDFLAAHGVEVEPVYFDVLVGKHGDHIGGERDAAKALARGDVAAACVLDANLLLFGREGTLPSGQARVLAQTPVYDHCCFAALDGAPQGPVAQFRDMLLAMDYADPTLRPLLDMEGLRQWVPGRTSGFAPLAAAVTRFGTLQPFLASLP